jgi:TolA-binding protein
MRTHIGSTSTHTRRQRLHAFAACVMLAFCSHVSAAETPRARTQGAPATTQNDAQRNRKFQKAEALYLSGRLKEAAAAFSSLTSEYPNDARIWLKYGNTLTKLGNMDEAAAAFVSAINLDASQGNAALNLSLVRLAQAQEAADLALARLAAGAPEHAQAETIKRQLDTVLGARATAPR